MKRPFVSVLVAAIVLAVAACDRPPGEAAPSVTEKGWVTVPAIVSADRQSGNLVLEGIASPQGRVVVSAPDGPAFAAAADEQGRFRIVAPRPVADTVFRVETRVGQVAYPAPYRLLVAGGAGGPIAMLSAGAASRRLDPAPGLDAVDSDGTAVILAGRAEAGSEVTLTSGVTRTVIAGRDGRWSVSRPGLPATVEVAGRVFEPQLQTGPVGVLERAGAGWRFAWTLPGGDLQVTWFPEVSA